MASFILLLLLLLAALFALPIALTAQTSNPTSRITVVGVVYCDTCLTNTFSAHSYFLPGTDVHIQCKFKASSPKTREQMLISVNRTTDKYGTYNLDVPQVDGVDCVDGAAIEAVCEASLISSSSPACGTPGLKTSTNEISVKSKQDNLCIYSLSALNYRPLKRNATLCGNKKEVLQSSFNSSKFFLPYFPPYYRFPWPPIPHLPPFPFPPLPSLPPLPPLPPLPFPSPPSLPFPFPPIPKFPPIPTLFHPPPPPAFNLGDPRTWIPNFPPILPAPPPPPTFNLGDPRTWIPNFPPPLPSPPPPPTFNLGDPRTWIPNFPPLLPSPQPPPPSPPPPTFNLGDPTTWIPYNPPSPPNTPQNQNP